MSVEESGKYDNFMKEMTEADNAPQDGTLETILGEIPDVESSHPNHWKKHWEDMPEFKNENNTDSKFKTIYVHFRNEEDYNEFCEMIGQFPSSKSKNNPAIWHPKLDRTANSLLRWIEEDD
jgi:hypothetical protein